MTIQEIFDWAGNLSTLIVGIQLILLLYAVIKGVLPSLYRLGIGLSRRKVVILADVVTGSSLKHSLIDSGLFNEKNICLVHTKDDLGKIENVRSIIMHWSSWKDNYQEVLNRKKDGCALIVYAPRKEGLVDEIAMEKLDEQRNVIVTNFRGRLLNDIVNSMITSGYVK